MPVIAQSHCRKPAQHVLSIMTHAAWID